MRTILGLIGFFAVAIAASRANITDSTTELRLDDMDNFSLMRFFDRLQFDELLHLADINSRFHHLIGHYMLAHHAIHKKVIRLRPVDNCTITEQAVSIGRTEVALRFLRHFGHLITRLEYTNRHHNFVEHLEISHSIQRYCARTLLHLKLASVRCYLIGDVNNTFDKVASVDFAADHYPRDNLRLHHIYPRMERLNFSVPHAVTLRSLGHTYARLRHLEFNEPAGDANLRLVVRANRQLSSLRLHMCPAADLLRFVAAHVPALEALAVPCADRADWAAGPVHMKSVRQFSVAVDGAAPAPFPIMFGRLDELEIRANTVADVPITLIEQNARLKVLVVRINGAVDYARVSDIVNRLPALAELRVSWTCATSVPDTLQLMQRSGGQVEKISFIVDTQRTFCDDLVALPATQWRFEGARNSSRSSVKYVTFVRQRGDSNAK